MRFFPAFSTALLLTGGMLLARPAGAADPSEQYLAALRRDPPKAGLTLEAAAQNPDSYTGMTTEVEGRLLGIARGGEGASLMVSTEKHGVITLGMSLLPTWLQPGDRLRVLVVLVGGEGTRIGLPEMEVVAVASASDVAAAEMRAKADAEAHAVRALRDRAEWDRIATALARHPASKPAKASKVASAGPRRPSLDARTATMSRSLSRNAQAVYEPYRDAIRSYNRKLSEREVDTITTSILHFSERQGVDPRLVIALVIAESSFNPNATSRAGAMGLGQIMPGTAKEIGLTNPYDPVQNVAGAVHLLRGRLDKYDGDLILTLASYNAGMGAVKRYKGVPPYRETQKYVKKVEKIYRQLCGEASS